MAQAALNLFLFVVGPCAASLSDGLPEITVASGLAAQLQMIHPSEHGLAVDRAVADGLAQALADEAMDINEVSCNRDYSQQCPSGWADMGDTTTCTAPLDYQGSCQPMLKWGGLTAQQKRQQASQCGAEFPCVGAVAYGLASSSQIHVHVRLGGVLNVRPMRARLCPALPTWLASGC